MSQISLPDELIREFCRRNGIKRLSLFGSVLRDDFRPNSDVDVLIEFVHGRSAGLLAMARMERELSELFGRKVDLRTPAELSSYFREEVLKHSEIRYAA
jgi:uncharacterized protein